MRQENFYFEYCEFFSCIKENSKTSFQISLISLHVGNFQCVRRELIICDFALSAANAKRNGKGKNSRAMRRARSRAALTLPALYLAETSEASCFYHKFIKMFALLQVRRREMQKSEKESFRVVAILALLLIFALALSTHITTERHGRCAPSSSTKVRITQWSKTSYTGRPIFIGGSQRVV